MVIVSVGDFFQEQNPPSLPPRAYSLLCRTATPAVLRWVLIGATWLHWRVVVSNLLKDTRVILHNLRLVFSKRDFHLSTVLR